MQSKNKALLHDNLVRANYDALTQTEVITVLDLCIECPLAVCIYQYEFQGEIITEKPIDDFKKEE